MPDTGRIDVESLDCFFTLAITPEGEMVLAAHNKFESDAPQGVTMFSIRVPRDMVIGLAAEILRALADHKPVTYRFPGVTPADLEAKKTTGENPFLGEKE